MLALICRLLVQQPVVEPTGVQFADAALQFAQMALLDLGESLPFLGCWPDADSLLIEQIHLAVEMFHQIKQVILLIFGVIQVNYLLFIFFFFRLFSAAILFSSCI